MRLSTATKMTVPRIDLNVDGFIDDPGGLDDPDQPEPTAVDILRDRLSLRLMVIRASDLPVTHPNMAAGLRIFVRDVHGNIAVADALDLGTGEVLGPILNSGTTILGECYKIVTVTDDRFYGLGEGEYFTPLKAIALDADNTIQRLLEPVENGIRVVGAWRVTNSTVPDTPTFDPNQLVESNVYMPDESILGQFAVEPKWVWFQGIENFANKGVRTWVEDGSGERVEGYIGQEMASMPGQYEFLDEPIIVPPDPGEEP